MGIPFFAKTIVRKYPNIVEQNRQPCSRLFLDLNCAIHQCTNNLLSMNSTISKEGLEKDIVSHTIDYILQIVNYTTPSELVFIAIDGIPPRAKMAQQRKRRFVSSWRNGLLNAKKKEGSACCSEWDTNAITPGTSFMNFLSAELHNFVNKNKGMLPFDIVLSDSNEPGEGESKILDYIKATSGNSGSAGNDIIYGLDADLIMLSLLCNNNNIFLLREPAHYDVKVSKPFLFFNIPLLRECISLEMVGKYDPNVLWDYVVFCFLMGNDFLPPLSFLKIKFNGIDLVIQKYLKVVEQTGQHLVIQGNNKKELNYLFLLKLLESLKDVEDTCICEAEENYYSRVSIPYTTRKSPVEKLAFEIDNYPTLHKFPKKIQPQKTGWRLNYYHFMFHFHNIQDINNACHNYLEGLQWTFDYYFNKCSSTAWYYKYNYSPTILDLYNFLMISLHDVDNMVRQSIAENYPEIKGLNTDLQLLMVLPPSSKNLVKPHLQDIMTNLQYGCLHYYPTSFKISTYLKIYLWECSPLLPDVCVKKIIAAYDALNGSSSKRCL
jgi:5'-3' exoribonuclease 1